MILLKKNGYQGIVALQSVQTRYLNVIPQKKLCVTYRGKYGHFPLPKVLQKSNFQLMWKNIKLKSLSILQSLFFIEPFLSFIVAADLKFSSV